MKTPLPVSNGRLHCRPFSTSNLFSFPKEGQSPAKAGLLALLFVLLTLACTNQAQAQANCYSIICPPDSTNWVCASTQTVVPGGYPQIITNNCTPQPPLAIACSVAPGTPLGPGVHSITCNYSAGGVAIASCNFRIFVFVDNTPPVITCPSNVVAQACPSPTGGCSVNVTYPTPVASDNSGVVTVTCTPSSGTFFNCGVTPVTCVAEDRCNNKSVCQFTVTVQQGGQPPSISCPNSVVVETCSNCTTVAYPAPTVVNGVLVSCNPPPTFCFPQTTTTVTCLASNACGTNTCSFTVTVRPRPPVSITCPTNVTLTLPCSSNCVPISYPAPTIVNGGLVSCTPAIGTCLGVGIHNVNCIATNLCGLPRECTFQVRIIAGQGEPPILTCPPDMTVLTCSNNCQPVTFPNPTVVNGTFVNCTPPSGFCFPVGATTGVTCLATNPCGTSTCSFKITVRKYPPAVITCPSNMVVTLPCSSNCVPVSYTPTVVDGGLLACNPPSGHCFTIGTQLVTCRATNVCGDIAGCEFTVTVNQGQGHAPIITCPPEIVVSTCSNNCQVVNYPAPTVVNGVLVNCSPASGSCFTVGTTTTVTCTATNACGTATCAFKITVRAIPTVSIVCPSNIVVQTCAAGEVVAYPAPTVLNGALLFCNPPSGSFFPVGTNNVTCCAVDQCQRTNCCLFTVTVVRGNPCVKPPLNMVLWLPFDEPVPPIANNIVAGAPNGVHVNGPTPFLGQFVLNSLAFDGANDYVRVPNYGAIVLSQSNFSIDAWVRRATADQGLRVIVSKMRPVPGALGLRGYEYYLNNGVMNLALNGPVAQNFNSGVVVPVDNNWHLVAVTVSRAGAGAVRFYLDGVQVAVLGGPITAPIGNSGVLHVGASTPIPANFFRGNIDEVEIFNRALTAAEIGSIYNAGRAGKCKIKVSIPWDVPFPAGASTVTVNARICNCSGVPQPIVWSADGPMPFPTPNGNFVLPPFTCTNVPIQIGRPTNNVPVGGVVRWTLAVLPGTQCPIVAMGSVINPGPIVISNPTDPVGIPGTNRPAVIRLGLNGLPPGQPIRIRAIGPDMEPDLRVLSLNGLPPGVPWEVPPGLLGGGGGFLPAAQFSVDIRFTEIEPMGQYTLLLEADLDGDGDYDTLSSFDVENTVVPPTTVRIVRDALGAYVDWDDMGDGYGTLESSSSVLGPWTPIPGALPPYRIDLTKPASFFDVFVTD